MRESAAPAPLTLITSHPPCRAQIAVLHVVGVLDHRTYEGFIDRAAALYAQGKRRLILDLHQTKQIELSGLFALHSIARLYAGERLLNPAVGWIALQVASEQVTLAMREGVKLFAPPLAVAQTIQQVSFCSFLEIYADLMAAMASFKPIHRCEKTVVLRHWIDYRQKELADG
jgi:hypothetical protein